MKNEPFPYQVFLNIAAGSLYQRGHGLSVGLSSLVHADLLLKASQLV